MEENTLVKRSFIEGHKDRIWHISWHPNGHIIATCSSDRTVRIWSITNGNFECIGVLDDSHQRSIRSCEWSPSGTFLASASFDATVCIWKHNMETHEYDLISTLEGHENEVKSIDWNSTEMYIATCSRDKSIWIWEVMNENTGEDEIEFECCSVLYGHQQDIKFVKWHPIEETTLFSTSYDDTIRIWKDTEDDWICTEILYGHTSTVWELAFRPTADYMVSASQDQCLIVWKNEDNGDSEMKNDEGNDAESKDSETQWKRYDTLALCHTRTIYSVDWIRDIIVTGCEDNAIRIFQFDEIKNGSGSSCLQLIYQVENAHFCDVNAVRWNRYEKQHYILTSASDDGKIHLWEYKRNEKENEGIQIKSEKVAEDITSAALF